MAALNWFVGRACTSKLPLSIGLISSVQNRIGRLSTKAGDDMLDLIESDYSAQQSSNKMEQHTVYIPNGYPFEIQHFDSSLSLRRIHQDERIRVYIETDEDDIFDDDPPCLQLRANVLRGNQNLEFELQADSKDVSTVEASFSYTDYGHLEGFEDDLKIRGIEPSFVQFLFNHIQKKYIK